MKFFIQRNKVKVATLTMKNLGGGEWELEYLKVDPAFRNQRLASELLRRSIEWADTHGLTLIGFVEPDGTGLSPDAIKAWLGKNGFKSVRYTFTDHWKGDVRKWVLLRDPIRKEAVKAS